MNRSSETNETLGKEKRNESDEGVQDENNQFEEGNASTSRKRRRTSPMWNHFTVKFVEKENAEFAYCIHCTK